MNPDDIDTALIRAGRMVAIGRLTPAVIHEINNALLVLLGIADLELASLPPESEQHRHLKMLRDAGGDIHAVVSELSAFTRAPLDGEQRIALEDLVRRVVTLVRRVRLQRGVQLEERYPEASLPVRGNAAQLMQALLHLLANGFQTCGDHGSVSVELLREGDAAVLMVRDTGPGPAGADEIFEPFVTTRASEHGSGLGLAAARLIARRHGGDVELRETSADGSVFALRLPLETR
ncbi:MAG: sensor histidine kinase [Gaiellaceae bacterium]